MNKPYRPSNGTEGMIFESRFCDRCEYDDMHNFREQGEKICDIHSRSLFYDLKDPEYPIEWIYQDGQPTCTAFLLHEPSELELRKLKAIRHARFVRKIKRLPYRIAHYRPNWWAHRKLSVAAFIHKHRPETCWAEWVSWAFGHKSLRECLEPATGCQTEGKTGSCYCGRFHQELESK